MTRTPAEVLLEVELLMLRQKEKSALEELGRRTLAIICEWEGYASEEETNKERDHTRSVGFVEVLSTASSLGLLGERKEEA